MSGVAAILSLLLVVWVVFGTFALGPEERDYDLEDGRTVHCLVEPSVFGSGLSCDWANAVLGARSER